MNSGSNLRGLVHSIEEWRGDHLSTGSQNRIDASHHGVLHQHLIVASVPKPARLMRLISIIALFVLAASSAAMAGGFATWTNATGNSLWADPGNWDTHTVPTASDTIYLSDTGLWGSGTIDLGGAVRDASEIQLIPLTTTRGYTIVDGTLRTVYGIDGSQPNLAGTQFNLEIAANLALPAASLLSLGVVNRSNGSNVVSGVIGSNGGAGIDSFDFGGNAILTNVNTYTGSTVPLFNGLTLSGPLGSINRSSEIDIRDGASLHLDNTHGNNNSRISTTAPFFLNTGTLVLDGNATTDSINNLGAINISTGVSELDAISHGTAAIMAFQSLNRSAGSGLTISLQNSGSTGIARLLVNNAAILPLVGGGGAAGTTSMSVVPYALGPDTTFVTYDRGPDGSVGTADDVGLRPLNLTSEYAPAITPQFNNVRLTANQTLSANSIINALALNGSALTLSSGTKLIVFSGALAFTGSGLISGVDGAGTLDFGAAEAVISTDGQDRAAPPRYRIDVPISAASALTKLGDGTLVLGRANTYSGTTYLTSGTLVSEASGAFGTSTVQSILSSSGNLSFEGQNQTHSNSFVFAGNQTTLVSVAEGLFITLTGKVTAEFSTPTIGGSGAGFTKVGPGTLQMTGTVVGILPSTVREGVLRIDGSGDSVKVMDGGTLAGGGTIGGGVEIDAGGTLSPGAASPNGSSALTVKSEQGLAFVMNGGTFKVRLNGTVPGQQYDQLILPLPDYQLSGSPELDVTVTYPAHVGDQFTIISSPVQNFIQSGEGTFAGLQNGSTFTADGDDLRINWLPNGSVTLTVIATPEPSLTLFFGAASSLLLLRRRTLGRNGPCRIVRGESQ